MRDGKIADYEAQLVDLRGHEILHHGMLSDEPVNEAYPSPNNLPERDSLRA